MLDCRRAEAMLAKKMGIKPSQINDMIIWGNHSPTMYPDALNANIITRPFQSQP